MMSPGPSNSFSFPSHGSPGPGASGVSSSMVGPTLAEGIELAGRTIEKMMHNDSQFPSLVDKLRIGNFASLSGLQDSDYPAINGSNAPEVSSLKQLCTMRKAPLPAELVEHFGHMQCNCMMGLFPQIHRAWLTIDSDIYVWKFEDCGDLAYFDGLSDTILSVALLPPRKGIFQPHIKYLLCLTTPVEIVLLGVSFSKSDGSADGEMQLLPEPLFSLPTDAVYMISVAGTSLGRVFLGGKDGCLYEFSYKAEDGWFSKKAQKINHSTSVLSYLVPTFINAALSEDDSLVQLEVDDSRNILYTRSEKGTITVYDLGNDGMQMSKVASLTQHALVSEAAKIAVNIDKSNFFPVVGISLIAMSESIPLSLVAMSEKGVRFYFSTSGPNPTERPNHLVLHHVRLPPGFSAASHIQRPSRVHMTYFNRGTLIMSSRPSADAPNDIMWILSNDAFPFQHTLMEGQSMIPIDGVTWAMDEIPQDSKMMHLLKSSFGSNVDPPLVATQHTQSPRRFVMISAQGSHIITKLRPVDQLRQLLIDHGGPDNEVIKAFFALHSETQATATCLILACSQAIQDAQVSEWATRAFFLYGGEPRLVFPQQRGGPTGTYSPMPQTPGFQTTAQSFQPHLMSTPAPHLVNSPQVSQQNYQFSPRPEPHPFAAGNQSVFGSPINPEVQYSGKHNGLYLYFSRLIRPVWLSTLVVPTGKDNPNLQSTISSEEAEWIAKQLFDLKAFLERNGQYTAVGGTNQDMSVARDPASQMSSIQQKSHQDALLRERQSITYLQQLVAHTIQVLGLWKVICDHQFHVVAGTLSQDEQNILRSMYFRDLIISMTGKDVCGRLVQSVINLYLMDKASTDAISNRLREVCPGLYNNEDAISSKAHEILIAAKTQTNPREREKMLRDALNLCRDIAAKLNLDVIVSHFTSAHCYTGVVELCLTAAEKRDPQGLALHYYKNGEPPDDHQGLQAFMTRMSCYNQITDMLRRLLDTSSTHPGSPSLPHSPGPPPPPDPNQLPPGEACEYAEMVLQEGLRSQDQLFHAALYQWLVDNKHFERLLEIKSPFLEDFLTRGTKQHSDTLVMYDLLWKHHEKSRSYAAAAKILSKLADRHSTEVTLKQRLEYLSRAIMCVKSGELGGSSMEADSGDTAGELLHDLEEKMEVARVQLQIVDALAGMRTQAPAEVESALSRLNADLLDISQLYQDYAEPYELWECQLAILHCAGHPDHMLIETMWENIIDAEIRKTHDLSTQTKVVTLSNKVKALGKIYVSSQKYFPLDYIIKKLEMFSLSAKADYGWVFNALLVIGVPLPRILDIYNRLYLSNDPVWLTQGSPNHLLHVLSRILDTFADSPSIVAFNERRQFTVTCLDAVGNYLGSLYTKHDSTELVKEFRGIQAKLERL